MPCVSWAPKVSWMSTGEWGHSGPGAGTGPVMLDEQVLPTQYVWLAGASASVAAAKGEARGEELRGPGMCLDSRRGFPRASPQMNDRRANRTLSFCR